MTGPAGQLPDPARPARRPADPERGLRGAISATLVLQAITVLLAIPVAKNTGNGTNGWGIVAIIVLAFAMIGACAFVKREWFGWLLAGLQVLTIAGWAISGPLGIVGIVFAIVFAVIFYFRYEYRRRAAAGELPGQQRPDSSGEQVRR
ncbi:DUF4233 domain-containing protein [Nakamurella lactea]|jgi:hypothetical protein|uniref:DUF4233 domain-containing protein n=1 Tax=Nakamurella lactea TaxID=459515 RepID=UPI00042396C0|nr:DUF4233 domain-containing protein [Nakamurella lactea]